MASKKENLPVTLAEDEASGTITYANEVVAIIAGVAANEVEGIAGMCSGGFTEVFGRNKNITKGIKVELGSEEAAVDIYLIVEYGTPIQTAAANVQENVRKAIESMTGLHVVRVDVHVQGVSFEKEKQETEGIEASHEPVLQDIPQVHVEFEGEPTPAESHESVEVEPLPEQEEPASSDETEISEQTDENAEASAEKIETDAIEESEVGANCSGEDASEIN